MLDRPSLPHGLILRSYRWTLVKHTDVSVTKLVCWRLVSETGDREAAKRKMQEERAAAPPPNVARKPALPDLFVQRLKEKGIE